MKLVTGIEAIHSGKTFRQVHKEIGNCVSFSEWIEPNGLFTFTAKSLREKVWEIKQEPREFWIAPKMLDGVRAITEVKPSHDPSDFLSKGWIKCREVID